MFGNMNQPQIFINQLQMKLMFFCTELITLHSQAQIDEDVCKFIGQYMMNLHGELDEISRQSFMMQGMLFVVWSQNHSGLIQLNSISQMALMFQQQATIHRKQSEIDQLNYRLDQIEDLLKQILNGSQTSQIQNTLGTVIDNQNKLLSGQSVIMSKIDRMRDDILSRIDSRFQDSVELILNRLNKQDLELVQLMTQFNQDNELNFTLQEGLLNQVTSSLHELKGDLGQQSTQEQSRWNRIYEALQRKDVSWKDKVTIAVSVIPGIVQVESSLSGLSDIWSTVRRSFG